MFCVAYLQKLYNGSGLFVVNLNDATHTLDILIKKSFQYFKEKNLSSGHSANFSKPHIHSNNASLSPVRKLCTTEQEKSKSHCKNLLL